MYPLWPDRSLGNERGRGVSASGSKKGTNGRASLVLIAAILVILGAVVPASLSPGHFGLNTVVALSLCGSVLGGIALFIGRLNGHPVLRSPLAGGAFVLAATALALPGELRGATPLAGGLSAVGIVLAALTCAVGLLSFRRVLRRDDGGQFALLLSFGLLFGGLIVPWGGVLGELRPFFGHGRTDSYANQDPRGGPVPERWRCVRDARSSCCWA